MIRSSLDGYFVRYLSNRHVKVKTVNNYVLLGSVIKRKTLKGLDKIYNCLIGECADRYRRIASANISPFRLHLFRPIFLQII